jgi:hypothetical protein
MKTIVMGTTVEYVGRLNDTRTLQIWNLEQAEVRETKDGVRYAVLKQ